MMFFTEHCSTLKSSARIIANAAKPFIVLALALVNCDLKMVL